MPTPEQTAFKKLVEKYLNGTASVQETETLEAYYQLFAGTPNALDQLDDESQGKLVLRLKVGVTRKIKSFEKPAVPLYRKWKIAIAGAAAIAAITLGTWIYMMSPDVKSGDEVAKNDIAPGKNGATITLANGKVIQLSDAKSGVVVGRGDLKYSDGSPLSPQGGSLPEGERSIKLTAQTAKGQTYQFTLPDGTKVWLNADSKLEFPSSFVSSKTRNVKLSGEGYFEVSKDKTHPFIVKMEANSGPGQEVEVLGTHFNINAYSDEPAIATTLLEGSVKLTMGNSEKMLMPGEQAISDEGKIKVGRVNMDAIVDWKNEEFFLDKMDFRVAMRKIARWYNIEVIYNGSVPINLEAGGWIPRNSKLSDVLKSIESTGQVKFKIEGKKLYVSK
jgi:hypothetical protein